MITDPNELYLQPESPVVIGGVPANHSPEWQFSEAIFAYFLVAAISFLFGAIGSAVAILSMVSK